MLKKMYLGLGMLVFNALYLGVVLPFAISEDDYVIPLVAIFTIPLVVIGNIKGIEKFRK